MAAKTPAKKAAPKKALVKASKAKTKAKTRYTKAQRKAYRAAAKTAVARARAASRTAAAKARFIQNAKGVQHRRAVKAAQSKAKPGRSGKRLQPVSGKQAVIRLKSQAAQAAGYMRRTQVYTYQQAAFLTGLATLAANRKALARALARKKLKPKKVSKKTTAKTAPRRPSKYAAVGAKAGAAAAARVKPVRAKAASKTRKAAGGVTPPVNDPEWITAGNDKDVENCVAVAVANHLLLHTGYRVSKLEVSYLLYRDSVWKALEVLDYHEDVWKKVGLSEYGMINPEDAEPGDIIGFETPNGSHCGVLMPDNKVISWGEVVPLESTIDEAWQVTWTVTSQ